jgi:hypothetical protein
MVHPLRPLTQAISAPHHIHPSLSRILLNHLTLLDLDFILTLDLTQETDHTLNTNHALAMDTIETLTMNTLDAGIVNITLNMDLILDMDHTQDTTLNLTRYSRHNLNLLNKNLNLYLWSQNWITTLHPLSLTPVKQDLLNRMYLSQNQQTWNPLKTNPSQVHPNPKPNQNWDLYPNQKDLEVVALHR